MRFSTSSTVWATAGDRSTEFTEQPGLDVEQAAAVGDEQMPSERRLDQVGLGDARRRGVHVVAGVDATHRSLSSFGLPGGSGQSRPSFWNLSNFSQCRNRSS